MRASAFGGAISASDNVGNVTITGTAAAPSTFLGNAVTSGAGGTGGAIGSGNNSNTSPTGGSGGTGGVAYGGGLSYHIPFGSADTGTNSITWPFVSSP